MGEVSGSSELSEKEHTPEALSHEEEVTLRDFASAGLYTENIVDLYNSIRKSAYESATAQAALINESSGGKFSDGVLRHMADDIYAHDLPERIQDQAAISTPETATNPLTGEKEPIPDEKFNELHAKLKDILSLAPADMSTLSDKWEARRKRLVQDVQTAVTSDEAKRQDILRAAEELVADGATKEPQEAKEAEEEKIVGNEDDVEEVLDQPVRQPEPDTIDTSNNLPEGANVVGHRRINFGSNPVDHSDTRVPRVRSHEDTDYDSGEPGNSELLAPERSGLDQTRHFGHFSGELNGTSPEKTSRRKKLLLFALGAVAFVAAAGVAYSVFRQGGDPGVVSQFTDNLGIGGRPADVLPSAGGHAYSPEAHTISSGEGLFSTMRQIMDGLSPSDQSDVLREVGPKLAEMKGGDGAPLAYKMGNGSWGLNRGNGQMPRAALDLIRDAMERRK